MCLSACTFGDLERLSGGPPPSADGGASGDASIDASVGNDAGWMPDAGADAGPRTNSCGALLFGTEVPIANGSFESGCTAGWDSYAASRTEETTLKSDGNVSCLVCDSVAGPDLYLIHQAVPRAVMAGEIYEVVGCVRLPPTQTPATSVRGEVTSESAGRIGDPVELTKDFQPIRAAATWDAVHASFMIAVGGQQVLNTCFLLDDVRLFRVQ